MLDTELIERIKKGDRCAFDTLYDRFFAKNYAYALRYVRNKSDAEDVVIQVFANIWEKRSKLNINSSVSSYLFKSVYNRCIDLIKNNNRYDFDYLNRDDFEKEAGVRYNVEDILLNKELNEIISASINNLPEQCKRVFELSRFEDLSQKEIAKKLNISENTVETHIGRALKKLRESLTKYILIFLHFVVAELLKM